MPIVNFTGSDIMKKILVIPNQFKDKSYRVTLKVVHWLQDKGCTVFLPETIEGAKELEGYAFAHCDHPNDMADIDYGLVLGGDGTIIQTSRMLRNANLPLLGINLGNLGFLAEIELSDLDAALEAFMKEEFVIEQRMMIAASFDNGKSLVPR